MIGLVLDVGCGGNEAFAYRQIPMHGDVAVDIRRPKVKRENFVLASGEALPFRDKAFSLVFSVDVLEHVDGPVYLVREMKRVSRRQLIVTPNSLHLSQTLMSAVRKDQKYEPNVDHVAVWSKAEMEMLLNRVGFKRYSISWTNLHEHRARWFVRVLLAVCPFPSLHYRALLVVAEA
jgi:SAM-dependent methyltransferase